MLPFRSSRTTFVAVGFVLVACSSGGSNTGDDPNDPDGSNPTGTDAGSESDGATPDPLCGRLTTPCAEGGACEGPADCADNVCRDGVCRKPTPSNGVKDGDETDVDCGGASSPACDDGKQCVTPEDCTSSVCTGGVCQAPSATDGVKNGDETGKDCGGAKAPKCATGEGCLGDGDCDAVRCDTTGTKTCKAPAKDDGLKNGTETDVDCGGGAPTNAPACAVGKACVNHGDCTTDGCGYDGKCVVGRSCTGHFGGDTCGAGEVGEAGANHESCCATIKVPGRAIRYGKYEITAGRMRAFIERTGGNVRAFIDANPSSQIRTQDKAFLPEGFEAPTRAFQHCDGNGNNCATENVVFGTNEYLGNYVFLPDRPCPTCGQGCFVGTKAQGAYGHPTYWMPDDLQSKFGAVPRQLSKDVLDTKSLNCTPQLLFAAFCKWDGGRLPTQEELAGATSTSAWGSAAYPWGASPGPYDTTTTTAPGRIKWDDSQVANAFFVPGISRTTWDIDPNTVLFNMTNANPFRSNGQMQTITNLRYVQPMPADWASTDQAYAIAPPGRFVRDRRNLGAGALDGIFDVAANLMETTADVRGTDNANHGSMPYVRWVGGSFEGHGIQKGGYTTETNILTKYGKMGARCVYDD